MKRVNIQAIKRNCVARRIVKIYDAPSGEQWVTNGQTAWLIEGLRLDEDALEALFNLPEKKRADMCVVEAKSDDIRLYSEELSTDEQAREVGRIVYLDEIYIALTSSGGMLYVPIDPIKHIREDYRSFAVRWKDDTPLVAVYEGMFISALCVPLGTRDAAKLNSIAGEIAAPHYRWPDKMDDAARAEVEAEKLAGRMGV